MKEWDEFCVGNIVSQDPHAEKRKRFLSSYYIHLTKYVEE